MRHGNTSFILTAIRLFNRHDLINKKVIRANHTPYVTKRLGKAIIKRSQLEKIYFKKKTQEFKEKKRWKKKITALDYTNEGKKIFFDNLDSSKIVGNKTIWKNV